MTNRSRKQQLTLFIIATLITISTTSFGQHYPEILKVNSDFENQNSAFGITINIHDEFITVGALNDSFDSNNENEISNSGAVYVFRNNNEGDFQQFQKLTASTREVDGRFGRSIAIDGNFLVIGATNNRIEDNRLVGTGKVHVFQMNEQNEWVENQILTGALDNSAENYGQEIALNYPFLAVSAPFEFTGVGIGAVYIYKHQDSEWIQIQRIEPEDESIRALGNSIAIAEELLVIGAHQSYDSDLNTNTIGKVLIYNKNSNEIWNYVQTLVSSGITNENFFGENVTINDEDIIISNNKREGATTLPDNLYYFGKIGSTWIQKQIIADSEFHISDLKTKNKTLFIGSSLDNSQFGSVFIYEKNENEDWSFQEKIVPKNNTREQFGTSLGLYDDYLVVGAVRGQNAYLFGNPNISTDFLTFDLEDFESSELIDSLNHTISLEITSNIRNATPEFTLSKGASAYVNDIEQESGISVVDFSEPVTYRVIAEDGYSSQEWVVNLPQEILSINIIDLDLYVYPNPTSELIFIESKETLNYLLYDIKGNLFDIGNEQIIDLSNVPIGIYVIVLQSKLGEKVSVCKVLKN